MYFSTCNGEWMSTSTEDVTVAKYLQEMLVIAVISLFVITLDTVTFTDYPTEDVTVGSV